MANTEIKSWVTSCGLPAYIRENDILGILCGYVEVPISNKELYEFLSEFVENRFFYLDVHGGVSLLEKEPDRIILGFDCGHSGDLMKGLGSRFKLNKNGTYKDEHFVFIECELLSYQLMHRDFYYGKS